MRTHIIYAIMLRGTGDAYVGRTLNLAKRRQKHLYDLERGSHANARLQAAWDTHGPDAFELVILEDGVLHSLRHEAEARHVAARGTFNAMQANEDQTGMSLPADCAAFIKSNLRRAQLEFMQSPEGREMARQNAKRRWSKPAEAAYLLAGLEKAANDPELLAKRNAAISAASTTPEARIVRSKNSRAYWTEEAKAAASAKRRTEWTPERRAAAAARMRANNPAKRSA